MYIIIVSANRLKVYTGHADLYRFTIVPIQPQSSISLYILIPTLCTVVSGTDSSDIQAYNYDLCLHNYMVL